MESILGQTLSDWELIVCDSRSDDGSWEYFRRFGHDARVRLYEVPRAGVYAGWNECLNRANGKYVYIATADDTCEPDLLEKMIRALEKEESRRQKSEIDKKNNRHEKGRQSTTSREGQEDAVTTETRKVQRLDRCVDIAVCDFDAIDSDGKAIESKAARWPRAFYGEWMNIPHVRDGRTEAILHACLGIVWWTITTVVFRRELLGRIGYFRTDRGSQADEEWEMRAALASDIVFVPEKLATWRIWSGQETARPKKYNRTNLDCFESVLCDPASGVPGEWKKIDGWAQEITRVCRTEYYDSFGLYGNVAKENLREFLRNVMAALRMEPVFLLKQAARGFKWSREFSPDPIAEARRLIDLFDCQWPPRRMECGK